MKAELISVGTEILLGDIVNTNAQFLSKELASIGIDVFKQQVIGDNTQRLLEAFEDAFKRSDIVITTGGLGPTEDDLTKETACQYFGMESVLHKPSEEDLYSYFEKIGKKMVNSNLKQVYFPKEAFVLKNDNGTAPGAILKKNNKYIVLLPGPPKEMKPMFVNYAKEYLSKLGESVIVSRTLRVLGLGESSAAELLQDLIEGGKNPTVAPYAKEDDVIFRITAKAKNEDEAIKLIEPVKKVIKQRLGDNCYGEEEETIETVVAKMLLDKKLTISTAESCTGGMIASELISYPGISDAFIEGAVTYANEAKMRTLNVKKETLDKFGAVSEETAKEMAIGIAKRVNSDVSVVTTGIAGPGGGTKEKPVGLVYIGVYYKGNVSVNRCVFFGNRYTVRRKATIKALDLVRRTIM